MPLAFTHHKESPANTQPGRLNQLIDPSQNIANDSLTLKELS
jgi:hypothetical protein